MLFCVLINDASPLFCTPGTFSNLEASSSHRGESKMTIYAFSLKMSPCAFISAETCKYFICCCYSIKSPNFTMLVLANARNVRFQNSSSSLLIMYLIHWPLANNLRIFVFSLPGVAKGPFVQKIARWLSLFPVMPLLLPNANDVSFPAS